MQDLGFAHFLWLGWVCIMSIDKFTARVWREGLRASVCVCTRMEERTGDPERS